jgi:hypothetical protein
MNLLDRVIHCQAAKGCLILRDPRYVAPVGIQNGFIASQYKFAAARCVSGIDL